MISDVPTAFHNPCQECERLRDTINHLHREVMRVHHEYRELWKLCNTQETKIGKLLAR